MAPRRNQSSGGPSKRRTVEELFPELYTKYLAKPHVPSAFVDEEFLRTVGLYDQVQTCLTDSGWPGLLTLQCETNVEDTCEFLASLTYEGCDEGRGIRYRHRGEWVQVPMEGIKAVFGWEGGPGNRGIYRPLEMMDTWKWMTSEQSPYWSPSNVSARHITRPLYYYLQHLFGTTLFGRVNGLDKPNRYEMAILRDMSRRLRSDYGHYWSAHLRSKRMEGPIRCGGIITYFLRSIHGSPTLPDHQILPPTFLDRRHFSRARAIKYSPVTGQVAWVYFRDTSLHQRVARVRRGAQVNPPPPPPPEEVYQPPPTTVQRDLYFNLARVFQMIFPPGVQWVPAPPGWQVGMRVPEQYIVPGYQPRDEDDDNE